MNAKSILYFVLSLISVILALSIFFNWANLKWLLFVIFVISAVVLFLLGLKGSNKGKA